tara:strand:- start:16 stop:543 length:528 start_codon:yes stop_codon:yes gene_type:complete
MSKFASGKNAKAISDRSGFQYPYRLMRREWNGLLVGPDEFETKHPQLGPFRKVDDPQALVDSRPEQNLDVQRNTQYGFNPVGLRGVEGLDQDNDLEGIGLVGTVGVSIFNPQIRGSQATGQVGTVTVGINIVVVNQPVTGLSVTASVGTVTVVTATTFDDTSVTLDSNTQTFDEG